MFFSPRGGCSTAVVALIEQAQRSLDVAVYSIGSEPIAHALQAAQARGVHVRVLTDHTQAGVNWKVTQMLAQSPIEFRLHSVGRIMHNKFVVVDGKLVETGSFNWTRSAEEFNAENCLLLDDLTTVARFEAQFDAQLWSKNTATKSATYLQRILQRARLRQAVRQAEATEP